MRLLSRSIFREVVSNAFLATFLLTFVLFLQRIGKLFEILVRSSAPPSTVAHLFALAIPFTLTITLPLGVLAGVLLALSRMSTDGEIIAMRAAGVPARTVVPPIMVFATLAMIAAACASLWLTPYATWNTYKIINRLVASELTSELEPRVFDEQFPNRVLYVSDIIPGAVTRWRNIFLADITPPDERKNEAHERGESARVTVAAEAIAVPDTAHNSIQLSLKQGETHEVGKEVTSYYVTTFMAHAQKLEAQKPSEVRPTKAFTEMDTLPLYRVAYRDKNIDAEQRTEAQIEFHQRLALPPACILLALIGIPLGISSRKGGKASAVVVTLALAFIYWIGLFLGNGLAKQHKLPVGIAMWIPNAVFAVAGLIFITRLDRPGDRDLIGDVKDAFTRIGRKLRKLRPSAAKTLGRVRPRRFPLLPQVVDRYVLSAFLFYFAILLVSFVFMIHVYTFFELLSDIVKNHISLWRVATYLFFLTPQLIYQTAPYSVLAAVLVTFGVLSKQNEVTAFKACGVSLYRLAAPVLLVSLVLSAALFGFDHYYIPDANRKQDAIRNEIKGRPVQTYLHPERKWIYGEGSRIYYYKYFDPVEKVMDGVNVYELDPTTFRLTKIIYADKARWEHRLKIWIFENGWSREFDGKGHEHLQMFSGQVATFPELDEAPNWFLKEVLQDKQMNYLQLSSYIRELQQSGFDTIPLQVQFYRKFAVPLFAVIMALISIPFAFLAGNRGATAGFAVSVVIAIAYAGVSQASEQLGDVNLLPATLAAWSPDALFCTVGLYFYTRMRT